MSDCIKNNTFTRPWNCNTETNAELVVEIVVNGLTAFFLTTCLGLLATVVSPCIDFDKDKAVFMVLSQKNGGHVPALRGKQCLGVGTLLPLPSDVEEVE